MPSLKSEQEAPGFSSLLGIHRLNLMVLDFDDIMCRLLGADLQYFTHQNIFSQVNAVARFWPQFSAKLWNDAQPEK